MARLARGGGGSNLPPSLGKERKLASCNCFSVQLVKDLAPDPETSATCCKKLPGVRSECGIYGASFTWNLSSTVVKHFSLCHFRIFLKWLYYAIVILLAHDTHNPHFHMLLPQISLTYVCSCLFYNSSCSCKKSYLQMCGPCGWVGFSTRKITWRSSSCLYIIYVHQSFLEGGLTQCHMFAVALRLDTLTASFSAKLKLVVRIEKNSSWWKISITHAQ